MKSLKALEGRQREDHVIDFGEFERVKIFSNTISRDLLFYFVRKIVGIRHMQMKLNIYAKYSFLNCLIYTRA